MDVPQSRLPYELLKIIQEVADSHFIAFDLEFSGVAGKRADKSGKLTLQQYYDDVKEAAEKYQILQVGLTIVQEDLGKGCYIARPYNFNISPLTPLPERVFGRVWSYHSGAISFLTKNGFKFDLPITQGVHYLSRKEEHEARDTMTQHDEKRLKIEDMVLKPEDDALINHIRSSVKKWQSQPVEDQETYLNIPAEAEGVPSVLNNYQMRLTHQIVRNEYPSLKTTGMKHFIQVTNPDEQQQKSEKLLKTQERERKIAEAVGFRWLMEAIFGGSIEGMPGMFMGHGLPEDLGDLQPKEFTSNLQDKLRKRRRVLVGHNCFTDLVNLYKCFIGDLPSDVKEFSRAIHDLLPGVVDTKNLASLGGARWGDTSLEGVERSTALESLPRIDIPAEYDRYQYASSYHEAGYDSLLTARVAIKLSAKLEREGKYLNKKEDDDPPNNSSQTAFGADEHTDVAVNDAREDQAGSATTSLLEPVKVLTAPLTAVKALFGRQNSLPETLNEEKCIEHESVVPTDAASDSVIVVRGKSRAGEMKKKELTRIKNSTSRTNIYESLGMDQPGPEQESGDDLSSSGVKNTALRVKTRTIQGMVKKGEIMPRWDTATGFWNFFGNKLQVNGSQEGICRLS